MDRVILEAVSKKFEAHIKLEDIKGRDPGDNNVICFGMIYGRTDSCIDNARRGIKGMDRLWTITTLKILILSGVYITCFNTVT